VEALSEAQREAGWSVGSFVAGRDAQAGRGVRRSFSDPEVERRFEVFVQKAPPDVVHVHHLTGLSMGLPLVAKKMGIPVAFTLHDWWLACARGQRVDRWGRRCPGAEPRRCAGCVAPVPGMGRLGPAVGRVLGRPWLRGMEDRERAFEALKSAVDRWICPSKHLSRGLGLPALHLPLPLLRPLKPGPVPEPGPLRLLFAGAMIPTKGPQLMLDALQGIPQELYRLRLVGPLVPYGGQMRFAERLVRQAADLGVRVEQRSHAEMEAVLRESDLLVFPSTWDENSPSILREAAAMGLPVVASELEGVREILPDAALFPVGDVAALRQRLREELSRGRRRLPAGLFPSMAEHRAALDTVYSAMNLNILG
jgi:glycosyltransferase involved in cell wall biosynthesis